MDMNKKKDGFNNEKLLVLPQDIVSSASLHPLVKNLYITDIGFFQNAQYHYRERKEGCNQNILIYCIKGEGFVSIRDQKYKIQKNSLLIIPKGLPHAYGSSINDPWDIYWVHFKGNLDYCYLQSKETITSVDISSDKTPMLTNMFDSTIDALLSGYTINNIIYACQCFNYFMSSVFYMPYNRYEHIDKHSKYIENSINFMKKNMQHSLSLEALAAFNNLSKSQITEIFKMKTNYSPINFFIRLKIQSACNKLDLTDFSISEIALQLGYDDQYYFSRIFKKVMGMCPSEYRKIKKG